MSILDKFMRPFQAAKNAVINRTLRIGVNRISDEPPTDPQSRVEVSRRNEIAYSCIKIKADAMGDPRLVVQEQDSEGNWVEDEEHPFTQLLRRPNDYMSTADLFAAGEASMNIAGVFYCQILRSPAGAPVELHPLDPTKIEVKTRKLSDGSKEITRYEWRDGNVRRDIDPDDMLVRKDWWLGGSLAPLEVAMGTVDADLGQTDFVRSFFNNAGVPGGILKVKGREIDQQEADQIRARWRAKYGRQWGNTHDLAVLDENADYEKIGANLDELDNELLRTLNESRICQSFGVPPLIVYSLIGLMRATYNNLSEAWRQFWLTTMGTTMRQWRDWYQRTLLLEFEDEEEILMRRLRLHWDTSEVLALQESEDARHERIRGDFESGLITLDEAREKLGDDPYPDEEIGQTNPYLLVQLRKASGSGLTLADLLDIDVEELESLPAPEQDDEDQQDDEGEEQESEESGGVAVDTYKVPGHDKFISTRFMEPNEEIKAYDEAMRRLVDKGLKDRIDKTDFLQSVEELTAEYAVRLFAVGAELRNVDKITDEQLADLRPMLNAIGTSAEDLADEVFTDTGEGGTAAGKGEVPEIFGGEFAKPAESKGHREVLMNRVGIWSNRMGMSTQLGKTWQDGSGDLLMMWNRGPTEEGCRDCIARDGTVKTGKEWRNDKMPRTRPLDCNGWNCLCTLEPVTE